MRRHASHTTWRLVFLFAPLVKSARYRSRIGSIGPNKGVRGAGTVLVEDPTLVGWRNTHLRSWR